MYLYKFPSKTLNKLILLENMKSFVEEEKGRSFEVGSSGQVYTPSERAEGSACAHSLAWVYPGVQGALFLPHTSGIQVLFFPGSMGPGS